MMSSKKLTDTWYSTKMFSCWNSEIRIDISQKELSRQLGYSLQEKVCKMIVLPLLYLIMGFCFLSAQEIEPLALNLDDTEALNNSVFGLNGALLFHHAIDLDDHTIPDNILSAIDEIGNGIIRFPGGAISDDYHYDRLGYGSIKEEHEQFDHSRQCNTSANETYCYEEDLTALRNYIMDYIDLARQLEIRRQTPLKTLYVLNFLSHSAYGQDQFLELDAVNEESDLDQLVNEGLLDVEVRDGIVGNLNALRDLLNEPSIEVAGIEIGNELYFHRTFTGVAYASSSNLPTVLLEQVFNPRIPKIEALFACYSRLIDNIDPNVKTAIPVSKINHNGLAGNFDALWNKVVRDNFLQYADGVVIHDYIKRSVNLIDPTTAETTNSAQMDENLELMYERYQDITDKVAQNGDFFDVVNSDKEIWITEYNVANNTGQWINLWRNTLLHGVYMMNHALGFYESSAQYNITKIIGHNLLAGETSFRYGCISVFKETVNDEVELSTIERVNYFSQQFLMELNGYDVAKISGPTNPTEMDEYLFQAKYFHLKEKDISSACKGKVLIYFANTSADSVSLRTNTINISQDETPISIIEASIKYMSAPHIYSSNGLTIELNDNGLTEEEVGQNVLKTEDMLILDEAYTIPKYSYGYIIVDLDESNCGLPNNITENNNAILQVSPVPARNSITFKLTAPNVLCENKSKRIELFNQFGNCVLNSEWRENELNHTILLDAISPGVYYYKVSCRKAPDGFVVSGKIVVI